MKQQTKLLRFDDLVSMGVVKSRMTLKRRIDDQGFPAGILLSPNTRAWPEAEVEAWLASRPTERKLEARARVRAA
jgi:predicted DNA-binding transcriptional regulator AlpA